MLVSETRRTMLALLLTLPALVWPVLFWVDTGGSDLRRLLVLLTGMQLVYLVAYLALTWATFTRLSRSGLLDEVRRATSPRAQIWEKRMGATPGSWAFAAVMSALFMVVAVLIDPVLRGQPSMLAVAGFGVVAGWLVLLTTATLALLRLETVEQTLRFPDDGPHGLADYTYVGVQVMTTFATSDVSVLTSAGRRTITWLSIAATVFNTIIVAILVSGLLSLIL